MQHLYRYNLVLVAGIVGIALGALAMMAGNSLPWLASSSSCEEEAPFLTYCELVPDRVVGTVAINPSALAALPPLPQAETAVRDLAVAE